MTESREQAGAPVQACKRVDHLARECREVASRADARLDRLFSPTRLVLPAGGRGSNRLSPHIYFFYKKGDGIYTVHLTPTFFSVLVSSYFGNKNEFDTDESL